MSTDKQVPSKTGDRRMVRLSSFFVISVEYSGFGRSFYVINTQLTTYRLLDVKTHPQRYLRFTLSVAERRQSIVYYTNKDKDYLSLWLNRIVLYYLGIL